MSTKEKEEINFTFLTENDKLIQQCIGDMQVHDWILIKKEQNGDHTTIYFTREKK